MIIKKAEFIKGTKGSDPILENPTPHVAFFGRSNVGKSSVINSLVNKKIAYSSSKPGRTLEINIFNIDDKMYFLDFPGFGYARVSAQQQEKLRKMIIWYITEFKKENRLFIIIIDAKVGFTSYDDEVIEILSNLGEHFVIVANKSEKLNQSEKTHLNKDVKLRKTIKSYIIYSATKKIGRGDLLDVIQKQYDKKNI